MTRDQATAIVLETRRQRQVSYETLGARLGRNKVWAAAALHGQATMSTSEAAETAHMLGLDDETAAALEQIPSRGDVPSGRPLDPLVYRLQEIVQVYGTSIKAVVNEMFGDGIVSAIDFTIDIQRQEDPKGDRVVITLNGKFLPYRKW